MPLIVICGGDGIELSAKGDSGRDFILSVNPGLNGPNGTDDRQRRKYARDPKYNRRHDCYDSRNRMLVCEFAQPSERGCCRGNPKGKAFVR